MTAIDWVKTAFLVVGTLIAVAGIAYTVGATAHDRGWRR